MKYCRSALYSSPLFFISLVLFLTSALQSAVLSEAAEQGISHRRIAILPFANYSEKENVEMLIMPVIRKAMEKQGFVVADDSAVEGFLVQERIRSTAYMSSQLAKKMGEQFKLDAVLLGAIFIYFDSENPKFGLSARLVNTKQGDIIWADYLSASGEDFTKILGLGTINSASVLVDKVVSGLVAGISNAEGLGRETESAYRVAVMPFLNKTKRQDAGMIVSNHFMSRMFKSGKFIPIEYGDVRNTVVMKKLRSRGEISYSGIDSFSETISADAVLVGVVENYDDGSLTNSPPSVLISARLIDARSRRIIWFGDIQLDGDKKIIVFDIGKIRTVDKVAFAAVGDMVKRMERLEWK